MKIIKRLLTPLIGIVCCVILSVSVFADGETGVPYISINGETSIPYVSSVEFIEGDVVRVTKSGILSSSIEIPLGVEFIIPSTFSVRTSGIEVYGIVNNYGSLYRNVDTGSSAVITVKNGGELNSYYGSIVNSPGGIAVTASSGSLVNIYGGSIDGGMSSLNNATGSVVNFYDGIIKGSIYQTSLVNTPNGELTSTEEGYIVSGNVLSNISALVSTSIEWMNAFIQSIEEQPFMLLVILLPLIGLGVGVLKRIRE